MGVAEAFAAFAAFLLIAFFARCLISSFLQGIRDVRSSPPPVPEDAQRRAVNRAYAEEQQKKKDAKVARRTKRILEREKLDACRRQQRLNGLPLESSPSVSVSGSSGDVGAVEEGKGTLDHLPDVREVATGVSLVDVHLVVEGDTPEEVEQAMPGAAQLSPWTVKGMLGSYGDQPVPADTEAVPPLSLQRRDAMQKRLLPRSR